MAEDARMALAGPLRGAEAGPGSDMRREGVQVLAQALMELKAKRHLDPERHARTMERTGQRNGYRERGWDTQVDTARLGARDGAGGQAGRKADFER